LRHKITVLPPLYPQNCTTRKTQSVNQASYLLDVVVAQGTAILKLLSSEDETLLIRGNALLVLDLGLDVVDGVAGLDVKGNGLTREGLDETIREEQSAHIRSHLLSPSIFRHSFIAYNRLTIGERVVDGNGVNSMFGRPTSAL
jgi:hypothetical protein